MKKLFALMLALLMIFAMVACDSAGGGGGDGAGGSKELDAQKMSEEVFDAMFDAKFERVFEMAHPDVYKAVRESSEDFDAEVEQQNKAYEEYWAAFDGMDFEYEIEVTNETELGEDAVAELQEYYDEFDLTVEKAVEAEVQMIMKLAGEEMPQDMGAFTYVQIDGRWYLDIAGSDIG